jgi:hypothetical protein
MRKWIMRRAEEWLELNYDIMSKDFKLYSSMNRTSKGKPTYFQMSRSELIEWRDKINDALELTK